MQILDVLIYAAVAAFLAYRLWSVLGQRDDGEDAPSRPNPFGPAESSGNGTDEENVLVLENKARSAAPSALTSAGHAPASLAGALDQMRVLDPSFEEKKFLEGAKFAFKKIVSAYAQGDLSPVAWLLGPKVLHPFELAIKDRAEKGQTLENTVDRIVAADIVEAHTEGNEAILAVEFVTHQVNILKAADGTILDGTQGKAEEVRDTWVFCRDLTSSNPNWQLVETRS